MTSQAAPYYWNALYWNARYSNGYDSGAGSRGSAVSQRAERLAVLQGVRTVTDVGCGDFNLGGSLMKRLPDARYVGTDVSDLIIERNQKEYASESVSFVSVTGEGESIPPADLVLCVDVLFHIVDDGYYEALLANLDKAWTKYLAVSAYEYEGHRKDHVAIRKFDPERFGEPILREVSQEDGQLYFYIFSK